MIKTTNSTVIFLQSPDSPEAYSNSLRAHVKTNIERLRLHRTISLTAKDGGYDQASLDD